MTTTTGVIEYEGEQYHMFAHIAPKGFKNSFSGYIIKNGEWYATIGDDFKTVQEVWAAGERRIHELHNNREGAEPN